MASKPTTVNLDEPTRERLDRLAKVHGRERSWIITQAIRDYLDREEANGRAVEAGIEAADRGLLMPHENVMAERDAAIQDLARPGAKRG